MCAVHTVRGFIKTVAISEPGWVRLCEGDEKLGNESQVSIGGHVKMGSGFNFVK